MKKLRVEVWSDIACPWCYVGKRHLEAALAEFPHRDEVKVVWRAFELDPEAPTAAEPSRAVRTVPYVERLARKYRASTEQAAAMIARMTETARADGLDFRFDRIRPGNTFDAHRLIHLAGEKSAELQDAVEERLLHAYLTEGESMADRTTLVRLGADAGLDPERVRAMLASDDYAAEVRDDEGEAAELGVSGVPFFVIGDRYAVVGAQPKEILLAALERAWSDVDGEPARELAADDACGPAICR